MKRLILIVFIHCTLSLVRSPQASLHKGTLQNNFCSATICLSTENSTFGTVTSFHEGMQCETSVKNSWFKLHAGDVYPTQYSVLSLSADTITVALTGFSTLGLTAHITYSLKQNSLQVAVRMWVDKPAEFNNGLEFDIETNLQKIGITTPNLNFKTVENPPAKCTNSDLNPIVSFSNSNQTAQFLIRNPFHAFWRFDSTGNGSHRIEILKNLYPIMRKVIGLEDAPPIGSTIGVGDTIVRHFEVFCNSTIDNLFYWGEHKNGMSQAMTMYWDELPNFIQHDNWRFMTTANADDVIIDYYLLRLLDEHPTLKMGYVLLADRILDKKCSGFRGWTVFSPYIFPDSLDEYAGKWCLYIKQVRELKHSITQRVPCSPLTQYTLSYYMKTDCIAHGETGACLYITDADNNRLDTSKAITGTTDWSKYTRTFTTSASIDSMTVHVGINTCKGGSAWFDDVTLRDADGNNIIENGNFEDNVPFCHYTNKRRHWVDIKGIENLVSAPEPYKAFLRRIENDSMMYGWEDRMRLGCHGYHHTPSINKTDSIGFGWEFQHYDPQGDQLRVDAAFHTFRAIGLTDKSLKFWRTPGVCYTKSIVDLLVDSGVVFMDPYFTDYDNDARSCFIERSGKRMWLPDLAYWSDYGNGFTTERLLTYLKEGHLGHIGGHPLGTFLPHQDKEYDYFNQTITTIEDLYPNLGYVFPDEYGDNANAVYALRFGAAKKENNYLLIEILGKTIAGNTIVTKGRCLEAKWNDTPGLTIKYDGDLSYIVLPSSKGEHNTLKLKMSASVNNNFQLSVPHVLPKKLIESSLTVTVYNLQGQKIKQVSTDQNIFNDHLFFDKILTRAAKGMYLCSVSRNGQNILSRIIRK